MEKFERIAVLRSVFECPEGVAELLDSETRWAKHDRGSIIAHQGDRLDHCYLVIAGSAGLRALGSEGQSLQVATVEAGEMFGSYPVPRETHADIMGGADLEALCFETARLRSLAQDSTEIGSGLASIFARQFDGIIQRFSARLTLSANGRVYAKLLELADDTGRIAPAPVIAALAVEAQTTRETASRAISGLDRRGVIEKNNDHWMLVAPRMLEDMVI